MTTLKRTLAIELERKKIGRAVNIIRNKQHMTQAELADKADLSRKSINAIENGSINFTHELLFFIAFALDISVKDIYIEAGKVNL